jgi:hypothetical protein
VCVRVERRPALVNEAVNTLRDMGYSVKIVDRLTKK